MNDSIATRPFGQTVTAKISGIECIPLNIPFKLPFKIASGAARELMETLIVKVHTDQGVTGVGETQAWRRQGSAETLAGLITIIKKTFEPLLIGRNACDIASIMHDLEARMYHTQYAQAAIGDALYDILGKLLNVPVYQLLGGKCWDTVRIAAVLAMRGTVGSLLESAAEFHARGFRHLVLTVRCFNTVMASRQCRTGVRALRRLSVGVLGSGGGRKAPQQ